MRSPLEAGIVLTLASFWAALAVYQFSVAGLSTLSGEQIGWGILISPLALLYAVFVAGTPALLVGCGMVFRNFVITVGFVLAALIIQILGWPAETPCAYAWPDCDDAFSSYRTMVILCWFVAGVGIVARALIPQGEDIELERFEAGSHEHFEDEEAAREQSEDEMQSHEPQQRYAQTQMEKRGHAGKSPGPKKQYWEYYEDE